MAARYFLNIGANWGDTANWSDTSGGAGGFSVPTTADTVFFDTNSGDCDVNTFNRSALALDFSNYTSTITMTFGISISGDTTLSSGMTISGSSNLIIVNSANLTSNGKVWPNGLDLLTNNTTITLLDDWTISGALSTGNVTINGNTLNCHGNISFLGTFVGTPSTLIKINGTGNQTFNTVGAGKNSITIEKTSGILTFSSSSFNYSTGTLTYISGDVVLPNSLVLIGSTTLDTSLIKWNNVSIGTTSITLTLTSDLYVLNTCQIGAASQPCTINNSNIYIYDTLTSGGGNGAAIQGTTKIQLIGDVCKIISNPTASFPFNCTWNVHIIVNTKVACYIIGKIRYGGTTFEILSGNVIGKRLQSTLKALVPNFDKSGIDITSSCTLTNFDKLNVEDILVTSGANLTMNKFFGGSPKMSTRIRATNDATNYNILFSSTDEKLAKFVKVSNATINNRSLLILTDNGNKGKNVGIKYINQLPNGISKQNLSKQSTPDFLVTEPNFITR